MASGVLHRDYYLPYVADKVGLYLVDAADFERTSKAIDGDVANVRLFAAVPGAGSEPRVGTPYAIMVLVDSQWYRVWLTKDKPQLPIAMGSPLAAATCASQAIYVDLGNPDTGVLRYTDAGPNQTCFDSDDRSFAIALSDSIDAMPMASPGRLVEQIHNAAGVLEGLVLIQGDSLILQRHPSGSTTVLIGQLPAVSVRSVQRVPGAAWLEIGSDWRRVSVVDGLSPVRHSMQEGFVQPSGHSTDSEFFYFLEAATGGTPTRLLRLRLDASADAELLYESTDDPITYVSNTNGRIWLSQGSTSPKRLWWLDKDRIADGVRLAEEVGGGGISFIPFRDRFAVSIQDTSSNSLEVKVVKDDGVELMKVPNAQFELQRLDFPPLFGLGGNIPQSYVALVEGPTLFQTRSGASLVGYDLQTLTGKWMFNYEKALTLVEAGFGPAGLGQYYVTTESAPLSGPELFAFDLEDRRFKLFAETPGIKEIPIGF